MHCLCFTLQVQQYQCSREIEASTPIGKNGCAQLAYKPALLLDWACFFLSESLVTVLSHSTVPPHTTEILCVCLCLIGQCMLAFAFLDRNSLKPTAEFASLSVLLLEH